MAQVLITLALREEVFAKFKSASEDIFSLMKSVATHPHKGKPVGHVGPIVIKELKYQKFRFYFITDGHRLKFGTADELAALLVKFVRMSEKKDQKKVIAEIERTLASMGFSSFK